MTTYPVQVSGIAPSTTKSQLHDFFSFCGTINTVEHDEKAQSATVRFEKGSSAKTALMLNGGTLDAATLTVTSDVVKEDEHLQTTTEQSGDTIDQSDKPRAAIAAEYLAKGYSLSDKILEQAIEMDRKQGISAKFLQYFQRLDGRLGERAFGPDQKVTTTMQSKVDEQIKQVKAIDDATGYTGVARGYYERAIASPLGQRVLAFYTETSKQVHDIHEEARRIAQEEKRKMTTETPTAHGSESAPSTTAEKAPTVV